jgi:hypothetical protein
MEPAIQRYDFIVICTKQLPEQYSLAKMVAPLVTPSLTSSKYPLSLCRFLEFTALGFLRCEASSMLVILRTKHDANSL